MAKKQINIDLSTLENYAHTLQANKNLLKERLLNASIKWAEGTKKEYIGKISYSDGFSNLPKKAYMSVEESLNGGLYVAVGHAAFIAKFLEVGTKPHKIVHKKRNGNGYSVAKVSGIRGNKALSQAFNSRRKLVADMLQQEINKILRGE